MKPHPMLLPLSWMYGAGVALRNMFFDIGILRVRTALVPVISVGNISAGGTGKTPFVEFLAAELKRRGRKVGIISRGYGRRGSGYQVVSNGTQRCAEAITAGDEPALLAERVKGVPIAVDKDRVRASTRMVQSFGVDVILLDDGFQHRYLGRTCDMVLITADELLRGSRLLPAGYRREPWSSLRRATIVVISKCADERIFESAKALLPASASGDLVGIRTALQGIRRYGSDDSSSPTELSGKAVVAFSGIGDPGGFEKTLAGLGVRLAAHHRFSDHHWYTRNDMETIVASMAVAGAGILVTTGKDAVRLHQLEEQESEAFSRIPLYVVDIHTEILAGSQALAAALDAALGRGKEAERK